MYSINEIKKYPFFQDADVNFVLDSLTGVVSRQYILEFAKWLIRNNMPFAMAMIDLDNFKSINDNYGHHIGDVCLKMTAEQIQKTVGYNGLVGRYGGDEFIILYLKANDYNSIHDFFDNFYYNDGPLRKIINLENNKVFITATVGSASFPLDAENFDDLFLKMDKALYRGKSKGRNCYIIYVESKHKDIVIKEREGNSLLNKFENINKMTLNDNYEQLRVQLADYLYRVLHPYNVIFIDDKNYVQSANKTAYFHYDKYDAYKILDNLLGNSNVLFSSDPSNIIKEHPEIEEYIVHNRIHAFVVTRIDKYGFILVIENNISRMWQDNDLVLLYFAATELKYKIENK